jgi:histidine triad (HIT) family protein
MPPSPRSSCTFCRIIDANLEGHVVLDEPHAVAFLDHRPLFPGHVLVCPRDHVETLPELPDDQLGPFFATVRRIAAVMPETLGSEGTFVANNNVVSQSVPHLHVHVVPRTKGDGMRGFFWPRQGYRDDAHEREVAERLRQALAGGDGSR